MPRVTVRTIVWASAGAGVLSAVLAFHLRTALVAGGPVAVPDIPAYLGIAQWAGGTGLAPEDIPFQPGYGLLIAPLAAVGQVSSLATQSDAIHSLALVVNSLAAVVAVVLTGRLGWVCSQRWWVAGAAVLVAAVHPSLSSASRIAWPETLLSLAVLVVAITVAMGVQGAGSAAARRAWTSAGLVATLAVALHARMIVLVVAVLLTAMLCRLGRREWAALGTGLLVGGAATATALTLTGTWPTERVGEAAQWDRGAEPLLTVAGQLLALGGGTVGLGVIGMVAGLGLAITLCGLADRSQSARRAGSGNNHDAVQDTAVGAAGTYENDTRNVDAATASLVCLSIGALGAVLVGGWTLTGSDRADVLLYGRYADPWAVPLAATALAWLATRRRGDLRTTAALGVSALVALVATVAVASAAGGYNAVSRRIMTLSFSPAWTWFDERVGAVAMAACASILLGVLLAWAAKRRPSAAPDPVAQGVTVAVVQRSAVSAPRIALGTLVAAVLALGALATVLNHRYLAEVGDVARNQVSAAEAVSEAIEADGLRCLAHDRNAMPDYALWLYRLELPQIAHERVDVTSGGWPCSELLIADHAFGQRCVNARQLIEEPAASWALWHLPHRRCIRARARADKHRSSVERCRHEQ